MKRPDKKRAESILEAAKRDQEFTKTLHGAAAGPTILRNTYECFRMIGEALLVARGKSSNDHIQPINELLTLDVKTDRPLRAIEHLRTTRHNINYRGYTPTEAEVADARDYTKACFSAALQAAKKRISEQ